MTMDSKDTWEGIHFVGSYSESRNYTDSWRSNISPWSCKQNALYRDPSLVDLWVTISHQLLVYQRFFHPWIKIQTNTSIMTILFLEMSNLEPKKSNILRMYSLRRTSWRDCCFSADKFAFCLWWSLLNLRVFVILFTLLGMLSPYKRVRMTLYHLSMFHGGLSTSTYTSICIWYI